MIEKPAAMPLAFYTEKYRARIVDNGAERWDNIPKKGGAPMSHPYEESLAHISSLAKHINSPQKTVLLLLMELGIPAKRDGFQYLQHAIWLFFRDPTQLITKNLYPAVAARSGRHTTAKPVEHSIRSVIQWAWERRDNAVWRRYFASDAQGNVPKPTNTEFISRLALMLELWTDCREKAN